MLAAKTILLLFAFCLGLSERAFSRENERAANTDPNKAEIVTSEIENFWRAYDLAQKEISEEAKVAIFQREYFDKGSHGMRRFTSERIGSAKELVQTMASKPKYYASIRESSLQVEKMRSQIPASFSKLKEIYPAAVFPPTYFLIGRLTSGGTTSPDALLIGTEMYCLTASAPKEELTGWLGYSLKSIDQVPYIVAHELIHVQQARPSDNLLDMAIVEGGADFIGELISGKVINVAQHTYGNQHERELWQEFKKEMMQKPGGKNNWFYNGDTAKDRPADLGYYIGYKICEAHYKNAKDKKKAIQDMLLLKNSRDLLEQSRYEEKFSVSEKQDGGNKSGLGSLEGERRERFSCARSY